MAAESLIAMEPVTIAQTCGPLADQIGSKASEQPKAFGAWNKSARGCLDTLNPTDRRYWATLNLSVSERGIYGNNARILHGYKSL